MLPGGGVGLGLADFLFLYRIRRSEAQHFLDRREAVWQMASSVMF
jgi:hypothetical protein